MTFGIEVTGPAHAADRTGGPGATGDAFGAHERGWSAPGVDCMPKVLALASLANLEPPDAVPSVTYESRGNLLIVAGAAPERARRAAERLAGALHVTVLDAALPAAAKLPFVPWSGRLQALSGYLGEFVAVVEALRSPGAAPAGAPVTARFDLVLDFRAQPLFAMRQPPQGYWHAPGDDAALEPVLADLADAVGEFEKPRYFALRESLCAHSRSNVTGCNACIEVCSTQAIAPDGDHVKVDPHLCMGCGACATVCPSGAMTYRYPRVADRGAQMKQLLSAYRHAGGADPCVVFHNAADGRELLAAAVEAGCALPARALPLEAWHVASIGLDVLMPAIAFGASQVVLLAAGSEDAEYRAALRKQMEIGEAILAALGYRGRHFVLVEAGDPAALARAFDALEPAPQVAVPATFLLSDDKRTSIEFAVEHLVRHAPQPVAEVALPAGSPWGEVRVDRDKCTMCLACAGACPESALMDGTDQPLLRFLERNCVQCGLCEKTCPEDAITLAPRLLLTPAAREPRILNETQPYHCIRCDKPFGTRQMVEVMMGRLAGHSMFTGGDALRRLQMCADCRVVDLMSSKNESSVLGLGADS